MKNGVPQVLLLGNGINVAYGGTSWNDLIDRIKVRDDFNTEKLTLPMPLQAILVTNDGLKKAMQEKQELFSGEIKTEEQMQVLQRLLTLGFDDILTTNYSYELEAAAAGRQRISASYIFRHQQSTAGKAEPKYMFHTYQKAELNGVENRIWHIHGESRKPDSMIIGHYWYGNYFSKMKNQIDEKGNHYLQRQLSVVPQSYDSWLDSFILGDVYVLGFKFDPAEIDMWWLLNRKKREKAKTGKLYFYGLESSSNYEKTELMRIFEAEPISFGMQKPNRTDPNRTLLYKDFYEKALLDIQNKMKNEE